MKLVGTGTPHIPSGQPSARCSAFASTTYGADNDPTYALRGALLPVEEQHHAAITDEKEFGGLLRTIDEFNGWLTLKAALQIMALCYPRPVELRHAEWGHFDFKEKVWTIPEHLAKMRRPHDIPLSPKALTIIQGLKPISGDSQYVFPLSMTVESGPCIFVQKGPRFWG
ncbi:tyrosine-type recombinase/integrase [Mesorhizobium sp. PUT5]|uniref:tyrosine-type recombinase/integrase n=1 Tax=Mesorhizobium sp. PUT5 TaxID=3454629 RepID=UPI003FA460E9